MVYSTHTANQPPTPPQAIVCTEFSIGFFRAQNTKDDTLNTPISVVCVHARIPTNMVCVCVCVRESVSVCLAVCLCFHNEILPAKLARLCACDVLLGLALEQTDKVE